MSEAKSSAYESLFEKMDRKENIYIYKLARVREEEHELRFKMPQM